MGQKGSKNADNFVTDNVTWCDLPDDDIKKYIGRAREYTAVDVVMDDPEPEKDGSLKKRRSTIYPPGSIISLLNRAHRKSYQLAFVIPKIKGSKSSTLGRNSLIIKEEEESKNEPQQHEKTSEETLDATHTAYLRRPKIKSRVKKEFSLRKMEATKTFLNVMMDIEHKWRFAVKDFKEKFSELSTGNYVRKLQEMISSEASKGGRLLSVIRMEAGNQAKKETDEAVTENGGKEDDTRVDAAEANWSEEELFLRMVFFYQSDEDETTTYQYSIARHNTKCKEQKLKLKKKQPAPKSSRDTNVTWSEDWLALFKENLRLIEVINIGELPNKASEQSPKPSKPSKKPREFEAITLCVYEKVIPEQKRVGGDATPEKDVTADEVIPLQDYDGLVREVWAPIDCNVQESLEEEAENLGRSGWELSTVLVTSHIRMKSDGSEFRKCAIFFQRPKQSSMTEADIDRSTDNLVQNAAEDAKHAGKNDADAADVKIHTISPKEKAERYGIGIGIGMKQGDLDLSKLRATSNISPKPAKKEPNQVVSGISAVQLKKVDREKLKRPVSESNDEKPITQQVKLRPTEFPTSQEKKETEKEVPWMATLEKKREAVMKSEETPKPKGSRPNSGEAEGEIAKKIDELKEKRTQRKNRLSLSKSTVEEKPANVPSKEEPETAVCSDDKTIQEVGPEESKKTDEPTDDLPAPPDFIHDDDEEETNETLENEEKTEYDTKTLEDISSVPPVVDISSLPVSTSQSDDTPLSHLYLPSPPPVIDDLPSPLSPSSVALLMSNDTSANKDTLECEDTTSLVETTAGKNITPVSIDVQTPSDQDEDISLSEDKKIVSADPVPTENSNVTLFAEVEDAILESTLPPPPADDIGDNGDAEETPALDENVLLPNDGVAFKDEELPKTPKNSPLHDPPPSQNATNTDIQISLNAAEEAKTSKATNKHELTDPIITAIDDMIKEAFSDIEIEADSSLGSDNGENMQEKSSDASKEDDSEMLDKNNENDKETDKYVNAKNEQCAASKPQEEKSVDDSNEEDCPTSKDATTDESATAEVKSVEKNVQTKIDEANDVVVDDSSTQNENSEVAKDNQSEEVSNPSDPNIQTNEGSSTVAAENPVSNANDSQVDE